LSHVGHMEADERRPACGDWRVLAACAHAITSVCNLDTDRTVLTLESCLSLVAPLASCVRLPRALEGLSAIEKGCVAIASLSTMPSCRDAFVAQNTEVALGGLLSIQARSYTGDKAVRSCPVSAVHAAACCALARLCEGSDSNAIHFHDTGGCFFQILRTLTSAEPIVRRFGAEVVAAATTTHGPEDGQDHNPPRNTIHNGPGTRMMDVLAFFVNEGAPRLLLNILEQYCPQPSKSNPPPEVGVSSALPGVYICICICIYIYNAHT
jgi:hypothetical protein